MTGSLPQGRVVAKASAGPVRSRAFSLSNPIIPTRSSPTGSTCHRNVRHDDVFQTISAVDRDAFSYEFAGVRIALLGVRHLQQDVGVAGLIERAPARQVFPAEAGSKIMLVKRITRVLSIKRDRLFDRQLFPADQLRAGDKRISPDARPPDVNGVRRHLPGLRPTPHHAVGFASFRLHGEIWPPSHPPATFAEEVKPRVSDQTCDIGLPRRRAPVRSPRRPRDRRWFAKPSRSDRKPARSD
jgi:hypothetical protein